MDHVCSRDDVFRAADHGMDLYKKDGLSVSGKAGAEKGEAVAAPGRIQCGHGQGPSEPGAAF